MENNNEVTVTIPINQYNEYLELIKYKKEVEFGKSYIIREYEVVTGSNYNPFSYRNELNYDYHLKLKFISTDEAVKVAVDKTNDTIKLLNESNVKNDNIVKEYNTKIVELNSEINKLNKFKSLMENMSVWDFLKIKCKTTIE